MQRKFTEFSYSHKNDPALKSHPEAGSAEEKPSLITFSQSLEELLFAMDYRKNPEEVAPCTTAL